MCNTNTVTVTLTVTVTVNTKWLTLTVVSNKVYRKLYTVSLLRITITV